MRHIYALVILFLGGAFLYAQQNEMYYLGKTSGIVRTEIARDSSALIVSYDPDILTISGLGSLSSIKTIELRGLNRLQDISFLQFCSSIETVVIDGCDSIVSIESLFYIPTLRAVIIRSCHGIQFQRTKEWDFSRLAKLVYFQIADCNLESIPKLVGIPNSLKYFNVSGNKISDFAFCDAARDSILFYVFNNGDDVRSIKTNVINDISHFFKQVPVEYQLTY